MVSNRLNALISVSLSLLACGCSSGHESRMEKLKSDHIQKYQSMLAAQEDTLRWADSILVEITPLINDMISEGHFEYVKNEFDELGRFEIKGTTADENIGRNYLHASVNEYGVCQLISEYRGSRELQHTQIRIEGGDGTQCLSSTVPLEMDGANYRYKNQGTYHETVTFVADSTLSYIDLHTDDAKLRAVQINDKGKTNVVQLTATDRKNLSNSYRLGQALALQLRCSQTSKVAADKITLYKSKLSQ